MSNIDKQALREDARDIICVMSNIAAFEPEDIDGDALEFRLEAEDGVEFGCAISITNQCQDAADVMQALLDELQASKELVELQRFKLEQQAEDLHQAKSLQSIHRDKRFEVEREFDSYKHKADANARRLAVEVCRLEDLLESRTVTVKLPMPYDINVAGERVDHKSGDHYDRDQITEMLTAAGITLQEGE